MISEAKIKKNVDSLTNAMHVILLWILQLVLTYGTVEHSVTWYRLFKGVPKISQIFIFVSLFLIWTYE